MLWDGAHVDYQKKNQTIKTKNLRVVYDLFSFQIYAEFIEGILIIQ